MQFREGVSNRVDTPVLQPTTYEHEAPSEVSGATELL